MAWPPRIKNSRSSAQPGTDPHDGVQATVTPAPDAEPPPGTGQDPKVNGTTPATVNPPQAPGVVMPGRSAAAPSSRGPRPIRYAHAQPDERPAATVPVPAADSAPPPPAGPRPAATVVPGVVLPNDDPADYETAGLIYEAPPPPPPPPPSRMRARPAPPAGPPAPARPTLPAEPPETAPPPPAAPEPADTAEPADTVDPGANEGLEIFGGVATTEATDDPPPHDYARRPRPPRPSAPRPSAVAATGAAWNGPVAAPRPSLVERGLGFMRGSGTADDGEGRFGVRDLPPDVQLRFWRIRIIIMVIVGGLFAALTRSWEIALTLAILAGIVDTVRVSRNAASYRSGGSHPAAKRRTRKQLTRMRREGYFTLGDRPIPESTELIDHLVVGPTGVYAIDSEKWDAKLPIRTLNGKRLYLGPESQKDRLEHAVWEASRASQILSDALGTEVTVRPALAIYGPKVPWDVATIRNVDVFTGPALRKYLKRRGRSKDAPIRLTREEVRTIYDTAEQVLPEVSASTRTTAPVG
jgi:Nuclease-related domain